MVKRFSESDVWRLNNYRATLCTSRLAACVDLLDPSQGLNQLASDGTDFAGFLLGAQFNTCSPITENEVSDAFVRGNDLVVTYAETEQRPFALQIYWRATIADQQVLLLDMILSLQTNLLESFPQLQVRTALPATEAWSLDGELDAVTPLELPPANNNTSPEMAENGVLLRPTDYAWSLAQRTHPKDRGVTTLNVSDGSTAVSHQLGGRFLEKGVIRRLRVRGAIVPRENDIGLAGRYLSELERQQPPLTV